jgi:hypothetical protein
MKKILLVVLSLIAIHTMSQAQKDYSTAVGMKVDFGSDYRALIGITGKHFFDDHNAGEAQVTFGTGMTMIGVQYQYHGDIQNANGLKWYAGFGPSVAFSKVTSSYYDPYGYFDYSYYTTNQTDFLLRPSIGLDYKISNVPLNFSFDWSPIIAVTHGGGFTAARFGTGFRYAF